MKERFIRIARQWGPWLIGIAILVAVFARIRFDELGAALGHGSYGPLAVVMALFTVVQLYTDSFATYIGLIALRMKRPFGKVVAVRGATYLLIALSYVVAQGGFGYYLHRSGERPLRATGATLFLLGINFAMLLVVTTIVWLFVRDQVPVAALGWTLIGGCVAFAIYLVIIAIDPRVLGQRELLAPLFQAGLRGHAFALAGRLPHVLVMVTGTWLTMRVWGIAVPFWAGMTLVPIWVIISSLPISPAGLGTGQAAILYLFRGYASEANLLAYSIVIFAFAMVWSVILGGVCAAISRRIPDQPTDAR